MKTYERQVLCLVGVEEVKESKAVVYKVLMPTAPARSTKAQLLRNVSQGFRRNRHIVPVAWMVVLCTVCCLQSWIYETSIKQINKLCNFCTLFDPHLLWSCSLLQSPYGQAHSKIQSSSLRPLTCCIFLSMQIKYGQ